MENSYVGSANNLHRPISADGMGRCPVCKNPLYHSANGEPVVCPYCSATVEVDRIMPTTEPERSSASLCDLDYAIKTDSPVAALVYLETFFKNYDWETFKRTACTEVAEISDFVRKIKIKFADNPNAWILDFESRMTPFLKKLESLSELEGEFLSSYKGKLTPHINSCYTLYSGITDNIKANVQAIFDALKEDIEYADRLGENPDSIQQLKCRFNEAAALYTAGVHDFKSFEEVPAIQIVKDRLDSEERQRLYNLGIDADATYEKAVMLFETQANKIDALRLFEAIREFRDSEDYIKKINEFFCFDSKLIKIVDKHFLLQRVADHTLDALTAEVEEPIDEEGKKRKKRVPKMPIKGIGPSFSLYEVIDGKIYEPASVTGISYVLSYYGNKIFYIKKNRSICSYDIFSRAETELDRGGVNGYPKEKLYWNNDGTAFYIRKRLPSFRPSERRGFFKSIFKRNTLRPVDTKNNFSLLKVDTVLNRASTEIERLVDITECYNNRMFYLSYPSYLSGVPLFMVRDLSTGESTTVLGDDCHIHNVIGDNVIYSTWDPNEYNKMLFCYNLKNDSTALIEDNIFEYFTTLANRVYYKVGNNKSSTIFSNNLDGTDRIELVDNIRQLYEAFDGWIYFIRGKGRNTTLFKISDDGKTVVSICTDISFIVSMTETHTYYIDFKGVLRAVDNDGVSNVAIASDVIFDNIIIDKNYIYFLRREPVGRDKNASSLYRVDSDGRNIKKLVFNADCIQNYDDNLIYVCKSLPTRFIATETANGSVINERQVKYKVTRFSVLDKTLEVETEVAVFGNPGTKTVTEKRGFFRKKVRRTITYQEISNKISYKKPDAAKVGEIFAEQTHVNIPNL